MAAIGHPSTRFLPNRPNLPINLPRSFAYSTSVANVSCVTNLFAGNRGLFQRSPNAGVALSRRILIVVRLFFVLFIFWKWKTVEWLRTKASGQNLNIGYFNKESVKLLTVWYYVYLFQNWISIFKTFQTRENKAKFSRLESVKNFSSIHFHTHSKQFDVHHNQ